MNWYNKAKKEKKSTLSRLSDFAKGKLKDLGGHSVGRLKPAYPEHVKEDAKGIEELEEDPERAAVERAAARLEATKYKALSETSGELSPEIEERLNKLSHTKQSLFFGSKKSPEDKILLLKEKVVSVKKTQLEKLQVLKDKIMQLKEEISSKRKEHKVSTPNIKRIILFQIKILLGDIDLLENERNRERRILDKAEVLLDKIEKGPSYV
tara:strand:- start:365 stop:991 length:627 start_codon:yes stop_codon:yes gene_type:complete